MYPVANGADVAGRHSSFEETGLFRHIRTGSEGSVDSVQVSRTEGEPVVEVQRR